LHITSCKIGCGGTNSTAILQALPGNVLTSLLYDIALPEVPPADVTAVLSRVGQALEALQQLRTLELHSRYECYEPMCVGPALFGCSAMSQLTRVELGKVGKHAAA
jgi:hypothetical protein